MTMVTRIAAEIITPIMAPLELSSSARRSRRMRSISKLYSSMIFCEQAMSCTMRPKCVMDELVVEPKSPEIICPGSVSIVAVSSVLGLPRAIRGIYGSS